MSDKETALLSRPALKRVAPIRNAGGFYRSAEDKSKGIGGVPLNRAEDAMVAAVRMAYKVADAQIDRSARLALRLREAGDRATGGKSERKALDATEALVFRAMMAGLGWLEGAAAEEGSPLLRLASAQYALWGSVLGLAPRRRSKAAAADVPEERAEQPVGHAQARATPTTAAPGRRLQIVHKDLKPRAVRVTAFEIEQGTPRDSVAFYNVDHGESDPLDGTLALAGDGPARLTLPTPRSAASGLWRAAVCDADGVQLGFIEIVL
ncbi:MAG: hypothetical protein JWO70_2079 [Betaproteobacteria bacterium]|nr:hypothetical protein [Betaproteobacteria bacterium]